MVQTERNITRPFMQCRHASRNWTLLCAKISTFFGLVFSGRGMSPDPAKIEATQKADPFSSVIDVRSLSGMTNYMSRFIRDYADIVAPLTWAHSQQFYSNERGPSNSCRQAFDPRKKTVLLMDASPVGLGAVLTQDGKVNSYGSKAHSSVEKRYS